MTDDLALQCLGPKSSHPKQICFSHRDSWRQGYLHLPPSNGHSELRSSLEMGPWSFPSPSLAFGTITFLERIQLPEATWRPEVGASRRLGIL